MPNGFLKVSAIDVATGEEAYVCQRPRNQMYIDYMVKVSIKKLNRRVLNLKSV